MQVMLWQISAACWWWVGGSSGGRWQQRGLLSAFSFPTHVCAAVPVLSHCLSLLSKMPLFRTCSFLIWKLQGLACAP